MPPTSSTTTTTSSSSRRLFSNLGSIDGTLRHEPGSIVGAIALVAGTTVGAGILALPAVTRSAGFAPSSFAICGGWCFMAATGLLLAEVHVCTVCELGAGGVSIMTMAERTLGKRGSRVAGVAYLLIHYALLVAYTSRSGEIIAGMTGMSPLLSSILFSTALGGMCFKSNTRQLDLANSVLLAGVIGSFLVLVSAAGGGAKVENLLSTSNWAAVSGSLPVVALSFVYHNVVPVVSSQLEGDIVKIRKAIIYGSAIPLGMFLLWDFVILGSLSPDSPANFDPLDALVKQSASVGTLVQLFSGFAIASSYVGFVLGLTDFLGDALKMDSSSKDPLPYSLTVFPPILLAAAFPGLFFKALDFAGTYGVLVLFGIMPAAMAWVERYETGKSLATLTSPNLVPGGKFGLVCIGGTASLIIATQFSKQVLGMG